MARVTKGFLSPLPGARFLVQPFFKHSIVSISSSRDLVFSMPKTLRTSRSLMVNFSKAFSQHCGRGCPLLVAWNLQLAYYQNLAEREWGGQLPFGWGKFMTGLMNALLVGLLENKGYDRVSRMTITSSLERSVSSCYFHRGVILAKESLMTI